MEFESVVSVKPNISKDDFLRAVLVKLGSDAETPADICTNAKFGEIEETVREVLVMSTHVELDYTCSIGYDRTETYTDYKKSYSNGIEHTEPVTRERKVTDWHPYNGHSSSDITIAIFNEDEPKTDLHNEHDRLTSVMANIKNEDMLEMGAASVNTVAFENAKNHVAHEAKRLIQLPGDHSRDLNATANMRFDKIECWKLPYYIVSFTYDGTSYEAEGFASGTLAIEYKAPKSSVNVALQNKTAAKTASKPYRKKFWIVLISSIVVMLIGSATGSIAAWLYIILWLISTAGIVVAIVFGVKAHKIYKELLEKERVSAINARRDELEKALSDRGYPPLTDDELSAFK